MLFWNSVRTTCRIRYVEKCGKFIIQWTSIISVYFEMMNSPYIEDVRKIFIFHIESQGISSIGTRCITLNLHLSDLFIIA